MLYVVGSGGAGVACAAALLEKGEEVTMLDVGLTLPKEKATVLTQIQEGAFDKKKLEKLRGVDTKMSGGLPRKLHYGSHYLYDDTLFPLRKKNVEALVTFAQGGMSTIWGASILPYVDRDLKKWPLAHKDLPFKDVLRFVYCAGKKDDLAKEFPLHCKPQPLQMSKQAALLETHMKKNANSLKKAGFSFGQARAAVKGKECVYCTNCSYGCPYELIYNSAYTLQELMRNKKFNYIPRILVEKVEDGKEVRIFAKTLDGKTKEFSGKKVFVAAGVLNTTKIMQRSLAIKERTVLDSQYFLMPFLHFKSAGDVTKEKLHTMAQLFFELYDEKITKNTVHIQLYTYNDMFSLGVASKLGPLAKLVPKSLYGRLSVGIGFLHSDASPSMKMRLKDDMVTLSRVDNKQTKSTLQRVFKKLRSLSWKLGAFPLTPVATVGMTGRSFHYGGSFPMREDPKEGETDLLGRPYGMENVHIADASVFPSLPGTTILLSNMANAYRIGRDS